MTKRKAQVEGHIDPNDVKQYTQQQVADRMHKNRTTLLRMEQRRELPEPTWAQWPQPHRVYSENDIKIIKKILVERLDKSGRKFLTEEQELKHKSLGTNDQAAE